MNYNSCLFKKIAIDRNGNIKNCPAMVQSFGNVKENSLIGALNHPEFKKWILLYFNSTRYDISFRTADHIIGEWSKPQKLVDGWQYSQLYGSYIHPISLKGNILHFIMSMWLPYNTYLMSAELKCNP